MMKLRSTTSTRCWHDVMGVEQPAQVTNERQESHSRKISLRTLPCMLQVLLSRAVANCVVSGVSGSSFGWRLSSKGARCHCHLAQHASCLKCLRSDSPYYSPSCFALGSNTMDELTDTATIRLLNIDRAMQSSRDRTHGTAGPW